jgi:hypothetical protein
MRKFTLGSGTDRKTVVIELSGQRMSVVQTMADASTKRSEREFESAAEAQSASEKMARELISRGFAESAAGSPKPGNTGTAIPKPAAAVREREAALRNRAFDDVEATAATLPPRLGAAPSVKLSDSDAPQKKKKTGGKKKKKKGQRGDELDKRVLFGVGAVGVAFLGLIAFIVYDMFIKPPTIVGVWQGGMVEHEISRSLTLTQYGLILDDKRRASFTLQRVGMEEPATMVGTYAVKGDRLKLSVSDEDGDQSEFEYKISLGRVTLELYDLESGKLLVQLIRFREPPVVKPLAPRKKKQPEAPPPPVDAGVVNEPDDDQ